jgi:uncharacterized pyridoxamine 5'-phosphate oxidase family protein
MLQKIKLVVTLTMANKGSPKTRVFGFPFASFLKVMFVA